MTRQDKHERGLEETTNDCGDPRVQCDHRGEQAQELLHNWNIINKCNQQDTHSQAQAP